MRPITVRIKLMCSRWFRCLTTQMAHLIAKTKQLWGKFHLQEIDDVDGLVEPSKGFIFLLNSEARHSTSTSSFHEFSICFAISSDVTHRQRVLVRLQEASYTAAKWTPRILKQYKSAHQNSKNSSTWESRHFKRALHVVNQVSYRFSCTCPHL